MSLIILPALEATLLVILAFSAKYIRSSQEMVRIAYGGPPGRNGVAYITYDDASPEMRIARK